MLKMLLKTMILRSNWVTVNLGEGRETAPLTLDMMAELTDFDVDNSLFWWKERDIKWFRDGKKQSAVSMQKTWNNRFAGKPAFNTLLQIGYLSGTIFGTKIYTHRLVWFCHNGYWPDTIDHLDGNPLNNRIENLSNGTQADNMRNRSLNFNSPFDVFGVSKTPEGRWKARFKRDGKTRHIGHYDTFEEAKAARLAAEIEYGFNKNHGRPIDTRL